MTLGRPELLRVEGLRMHFPIERGAIFRRRVGTIRALDGVDLDVGEGETVGLVGESGSGKSTLARCVVRLYRPTAGRILFGGQDLAPLSHRQLLPIRPQLQMIFQDPYASLNPRMTVSSIVAEPLRLHTACRGRELEDRVSQALELVGLDPRYKLRYPHEFSGGQRQRIGLARALVLRPRLILCDEPVSALDVSIQAQVINLLHELRERLGIAYLFIAHDLSVVRHISHRVAVMYLGRIVESAPSRELYRNPLHPYTQALLSAVPIPDPAAQRRRKRILLSGEIPSPDVERSGCDFASRCPIVKPRCREAVPPLERKSDGHLAACFEVSSTP
jgi:oligopeptide transport system ATP-binding protein